MQAIILAAGMGTRLGDLTKEIPKCLVKVDGKPIISYMLEELENLGIKETIIVVGYQADVLSLQIGNNVGKMHIRYVHNAIYSSTNNIHSLLLGSDAIDDDFLLIEGDVLLKPGVLRELLDRKEDCIALTSPYNKNSMNGTILEMEKVNIAKKLVLKKYQDFEFDYTNTQKTVNVYSIHYDCFVKKILPTLSYVRDVMGVQSYYEAALGVLLYMEAIQLNVLCIEENTWYEIDDQQDLEIAIKGVRLW